MIFVVKVKEGALPTMVCVPGVSGSTCATQPCPTDRPVVPAGRSKMLPAGRTMFIGGVSTSFTGTEWPSTATEGAVCASLCSAQARNSASVVPFPSNVLHSTEVAVTKILVPAFMVHDGPPLPRHRDGPGAGHIVQAQDTCGDIADIACPTTGRGEWSIALYLF